MALDSTVITGGADFCFIVLQTGSALGAGAVYPAISYTLAVYLLQISPGTHLELDRLNTLQSHAAGLRFKPKKRVTPGLEPPVLKYKGFQT